MDIQRLYLKHSRKYAAIFTKIVGVKCMHISYYAWEYLLPNHTRVEIEYATGWGIKPRFRVYHKGTLVVNTNSFRELLKEVTPAIQHKCVECGSPAPKPMSYCSHNCYVDSL